MNNIGRIIDYEQRGFPQCVPGATPSFPEGTRRSCQPPTPRTRAVLRADSRVVSNAAAGPGGPDTCEPPACAPRGPDNASSLPARPNASLPPRRARASDHWRGAPQAPPTGSRTPGTPRARCPATPTGHPGCPSGDAAHACPHGPATPAARTPTPRRRARRLRGAAGGRAPTRRPTRARGGAPQLPGWPTPGAQAVRVRQRRPA